MKKAELFERSEFCAFFIVISPSDLSLDILSPVTRKPLPHPCLFSVNPSFHNPYKIPIPLDFSCLRAYNCSIQTDEEE